VAETRQHFQNVLLLVLRFLESRQNASPSTLGGRAKYLFDGPGVLENQLGADLADYITGGPGGHYMKAEVREIGGGRVDVLISVEGLEFVIELKREQSDSSRAALDHYVPQTVAYQSTRPRLGVLMVLDLTARTGPDPHFRHNVWTTLFEVSNEDSPRGIVVLRVPGNRQRPSALSR
jgi:hypothetical protein